MARNGGFVQTSLSPTEAPNTVASPIDTFSARTATSPGAQFLEGIGKLTKPVATALQDYDQQAGEEAEAQANLKALTASPEDLRNEIASGNYFGLAHRRAQSALKVMDASNRVFAASSELDGMKARGELAGPDAEARVKLLIGAHAESLTGDPLAEKQFARGMVPVMRKYTTDVYQANVADAETNKAAQLYSYMVRSRNGSSNWSFSARTIRTNLLTSRAEAARTGKAKSCGSTRTGQRGSTAPNPNAPTRSRTNGRLTPTLQGDAGEIPVRLRPVHPARRPHTRG